jgi:hypothetical protein
MFSKSQNSAMLVIVCAIYSHPGGGKNRYGTSPETAISRIAHG